MMLDERYVDAGNRIQQVYSIIKAASKGQSAYTFDENAELASYCEPALNV